MSNQPPPPRRRIGNRVVGACVAIVLVIGAAVFVASLVQGKEDGEAAGPASAGRPDSSPADGSRSPTDARFVAELGRSAPQLVDGKADLGVLLSMANVACGWVQMGKDREEIAGRIMGVTYTHDEALAITNAAMTGYCPNRGRK
ncbi:DUF732 domain-containing protein [Embleya sp. NPDC008237]|uniref:DUF732 domain-containing protein n=1 Tax=Embleya sp. NPDC008237 TaxID=3363978 RepID=UPI0036EC964B